jgi:hypothetical protein
MTTGDRLSELNNGQNITATMMSKCCCCLSMGMVSRSPPCLALAVESGGLISVAMVLQQFSKIVVRGRDLLLHVLFLRVQRGGRGSLCLIENNFGIVEKHQGHITVAAADSGGILQVNAGEL